MTGLRQAPTVAVRGTGSIGMQHAAALRAAGALPVLAPLRPARAAELRDAGAQVVGGLSEAKAAGAVAAVIATDTARHAEDALEALELGLDVLVEKPLAADAAQSARVRDAARRLGRRGFVACVLRFDPGLAGFRAALPRLGAIHHVSVACQSYLPDWRPQRDYRLSYSARVEEGGVLRDMIHEVDYACWCFGWPERVAARLGNSGRLGIASEESAELWWEAGGAEVSVRLDYLSRPTQRWIQAAGARGTLRWDFVAQSLELRPLSGAPSAERRESTKEGRLALEDASFLRELGAGPRGPLPDLDEGTRALAVCDAAREASRDRRWVEVRL